MLDTRIVRARTWLRSQPDRPLIILYAHLMVIALYAMGRAVSAVPFRSGAARTLIASPLMPSLHALGAIALVLALVKSRDGVIATATTSSLTIWTFTTIELYFAATQRNPPLALWACGASSVITLACVLMAVRWRLDGDNSEDS